MDEHVLEEKRPTQAEFRLNSLACVLQRGTRIHRRGSLVVSDLWRLVCVRVGASLSSLFWEGFNMTVPRRLSPNLIGRPLRRRMTPTIHAPLLLLPTGVSTGRCMSSCHSWRFVRKNCSNTLSTCSYGYRGLHFGPLVLSAVAVPPQMDMYCKPDCCMRVCARIQMVRHTAGYDSTTQHAAGRMTKVFGCRSVLGQGVMVSSSISMFRLQ